MIAFLKSWCEGIIVAVMISILIESILPEGNNKKYVKVVIGIYIVFTILNPFLGKLNSDIEFDNHLDLATIETATVDPKNIQELYANGIKETLRNKIEEEFELKVTSIEILYDANYENIENITLKVAENGVSEVEKVEIGNATQSEKSDPNYDTLRSYISETYELDGSKIIIN